MLTCISPIDGSRFAERPVTSPDDVHDALGRAHRAQMRWRQVPLDERVALVLAGIAKLGAMNDEVVPELAWMMGRPIRYGGEFQGVDERASYMAALAPDALAPLVVEASDRFERRIVREPLGLVLVIAPWNYPYLTAINSVVPALVAGNAVLIKPSTQTLLVGERLGHAFATVGLPEGTFQNLFLDHGGAEALIAAGAVDAVNFTGSVAGGRAIERAAAGTFTSVSLELGGKDPAYVMADADLDAAADTLVDAAMYNSGQCCCGIERVYVASEVYAAFVERAVAVAQALKLGNPLDAETTLGPMANVRVAGEVRSQVAEAIVEGARSHVDRRAFANADDGTYVAPQVLTEVHHGMRVMREETFGPVVGIMRVTNDAEAVDLMNDSPYGLTASLWTNDPARAARLGAQIETGTVYMNRADYLDPALCWTGCKDSGRGGSLSVIGYHNLTRPKSFHLRKAP